MWLIIFAWALSIQIWYILERCSICFCCFFLTDFEGEKNTFLSISEVRINGQRSSPSVLRGWEPRVHARSFRFIFRRQLRIVTMDIVRNQYSTVHTAKQWLLAGPGQKIQIGTPGRHRPRLLSVMFFFVRLCNTTAWTPFCPTVF